MATQKNSHTKSILLVGGTVAVLCIGLAVAVSVNKKNSKKLLDDWLAYLTNPSSNDVLEGGGELGTSDDLYSSDIWNPRIYMAKKGISNPTIDIATAKKYAQQIYDSKGLGLLPDNERQVITIFQKMRNRTDVAKLADAFPLIAKGESLYPYLQSFMNNEGVLFSDKKNYTTDILNIIKKLPV